MNSPDHRSSNHVATSGDASNQAESLGTTRHLNSLSLAEVRQVVRELTIHVTALTQQNEFLRQIASDFEGELTWQSTLFDHLPIGIMMLNRDGHILRCNIATQDLLGFSTLHLVRRRLASIAVAEHVVKVSRHISQALATGAASRELVQLNGAGGKVVDVNMHFAAMDARISGHAIEVCVTLSPAESQSQIDNQHQQIHDSYYRIANDLLVASQETSAAAQPILARLEANLGDLRDVIPKLADRMGASADLAGLEQLNTISHLALTIAQQQRDLSDLVVTGNLPMSFQTVDVTAMVNSIVQDLRDSGMVGNVLFSIQPALQALGDPRFLKIVIERLLLHACRSARQVDRAKIDVGQEQSDNGVRFFILFEEKGLDADKARRLFRPNQPGWENELETGSVELIVVQRIINRHGGTVWAESRSHGEAAIFFTLWSGIPT